MWMPVGETLLILMAMAVVAIGLLLVAPGLAIAFLVLLVPGWAITEWRARSRKEPMPAHRKVAKIVLTTVLIPLLPILCLFVLLFEICFPMMH